MFLKFLLFSLVFFSGFLPITSSLADDASGDAYQYFLKQGVLAYQDHDDLAAVFYFNRAHVLYPSADEPVRYLDILKNSSGSSRPGVPRQAVESASSRYDRFVVLARKASLEGKREEALEYFQKAHEVDPVAQEPLNYLNLYQRADEGRLKALNVGASSQDAQREKIIAATLDQWLHANMESSKKIEKKLLVSASGENIKKAESDRVFVDQKKKEQVVSLDDIINANVLKPSLRMEMGSSILIEGRDFRRFLETDQEVIQVTLLSGSQMRVKALRRSGTSLHIWDDRGRTTIYVEVVLPDTENQEKLQEASMLERARPFRMNYSLDNGSYFYGSNIPGLERTLLSVEQTIGLQGETPYGFLDASLMASGWHPITEISTYTVGLSDIPVTNVDDLDLRIFDYSRTLSSLSLPNGRFQGASGRVVFLDNLVGVSASRGMQDSAVIMLSKGIVSRREIFVDAFQLELFPTHKTRRYTFNYATGWGAERDEYLTKNVYSVTGKERVGKVDLNAELARDDHQFASLAGADWANGLLKQGLYFRDIDKEFTTIISAPADQGEIGGTWVTTADWGSFVTNSFVDIYQNRAYPSEESPQDLNYDTNARVGIPFAEVYSLDVSGRYLHTPGEEFSRRHVGVDARLSRDVLVWGGRHGVVYAGAGHQRSRFSFSPESEYNRYSLIAGLSLPFTDTLSAYLNYEFSWLHEMSSANDFNPAALNAGINYSKALTEKLSVNGSVSYRDEQDVLGRNSFLAGEDSAAISVGLLYKPKDDVSLFFDARMRTAWAQVLDAPSYHEMDLRFGTRMAWGTGVSWSPLGTVAGVVFKDLDGDRVFGPKDEGIPGVRVKIGDKEAVTNERGIYQTIIRAKRVLVSPTPENIPPGLVFVTPTFAKVDILSARTRHVDFGFTSHSGIYGAAFVDNNGNNIPDENDRFIGRVRLVLDGQTVCVTQNQGTYFFKDISKGRHVLSIDMKDLPEGLIPMVKVKNELNIEEGTTYVFHIPFRVSGEKDLENNN